MQKGMSYPWLMRLSLSAAIALPSTTLLWLAIPASAAENIHHNTSASTTVAANSTQKGGSASVKPHGSAPEQPGETVQFSASVHGANAASSRHDHQSGAALALAASVSATPTPMANPATTPTPLTASEGSGRGPVVSSNDQPVAVNTVLPTVEIPQFGVLFSQAESEAESEPLDAIETDDAETPILDELEESNDDSPELPESVLEEAAPETPALEAIEETETLETEPTEPLLEEAVPEAPVLEDEEDLLDAVEDSEDADGDEVFSPLPESDVDAEDDELDIEEEIENLGIPETEDVLPENATGEPVLIPEDRVVDSLEFLNPDPNPLLIQTAPEEVEIVGTQPLTLEEAIELAYRNNPDLRVALLELEQSRASLREAQADLYPTVSINGNLQGRNTTDASTQAVPTPGGGLAFETTQNEELGVALSAQGEVVYNVYSSGRRGASIRAAEEQVQLSELEVERRREELRLATANEYYDLQAAIEAIRISQAFLEEAERNLRDTALREEVGVGTRFDVLRAQVQVANARQDLVNSQRARQVAQRSLARRLNVPPSLTITTVPVDIAGSWPLDLEESIVLAYQNRAELEQQLTQREINEELITAELAALGPQVDVFANYSISDTLTQSDSFNDNYSFGARVSWTLFEGGAAQARARQRELDIEIAERNFEEARNTIRLSVESAYYNLQSNLTNIDTARLAVEQAQEALDLAILRFDAGVGTQLDILNAQSELTDAEVNLVQAIVGYNRSLAELKRAVSNLPEPYYEETPY